jgi:hypothetical protein
MSSRCSWLKRSRDLSDENLVEFIPASSLMMQPTQQEHTRRRLRGRVPGDITAEEVKGLPVCGVCKHHVKMSSPASCYDEEGRVLDPNCSCDCGEWFRRHQTCPNCSD